MEATIGGPIRKITRAESAFRRLVYRRKRIENDDMSEIKIDRLSISTALCRKYRMDEAGDGFELEQLRIERETENHGTQPQHCHFQKP